jgi:hypothetical protein
MNNRRVTLAVLCMACAGVCFSAPGITGERKLTIAVIDYAGLPDPVMEPALQLARRIFHQAGIEAAWVTCQGPGNCSEPLPAPGRYISMLVMPGLAVPLSGGKQEGDRAGLALTGISAQEQPRAWAFYQAVENLSERMQRPVPLVLGSVMVHEIAHVLGLGHQNCGIMRAAMCPRDVDAMMQGLVFDAAECRKLCAGANLLQPGSANQQVAAARPTRR